MLHLYYSNQLANHKDILVNILGSDPNPNPFASETILVQSQGMAQWLQLQIADQLGIDGHLTFPYPTRFLWEQYRLLLPELPKENVFERSTIVWRLMRLIPIYLHLPAFAPLAFYLTAPDQLKLYQLASKVADLFDQYLVYRPHWLLHWENNASGSILDEIRQSPTFRNGNLADIEQSIAWQGTLWNALVAEIQANSSEQAFSTSHRAYLQKRYFDKLDNLSEAEKQKLPARFFVFGISALPLSQLAVLKKLSEHCNVHLFFTNPSEQFWGDQREDRIVEKLALNQHIDEQDIQSLLDNQGNPLLASWGKQGKEFLNLLLEQDPDTIVPFFEPIEGENLSLLAQIKRAILHYEHQTEFQLQPADRSVQIHSCHSKMREVEVLHNQLLSLFEQDPTLTPNDIIVMSADIDSYAPYIEAVFSRYDYHDKRHIPFTLSDQKISHIDPIIKSFLTLLNLKEKRFSVEELLELLNIDAIRSRYQLSEGQLATLREWVQGSGVRAGLTQDNPTWQNYNSWENGLNRLLLGNSLKAENGQWQSLVAFDESYGLSAEPVGMLAKFIDALTAWQVRLNQPQPMAIWKVELNKLLDEFYLDEGVNHDSLQQLSNTIEQLNEQIQSAAFEQPISIEVLAQLFEQRLNEQRSHLNFLVGKVNFCTLMPMRAIPFKVVCLLGMNEGEFPRQQTINSFDLMQYAQQKGDRAKRDDDRYLFLEALLSAQSLFYISYIGHTLTDNQNKLPSILVAQLLDYLAENLHSSVDSLTQHHPMSTFSPRNFQGEHFSYDNAWLQAVEQTEKSATFLSPLAREVSDIPNEVTLDQLIAYLQDPYRDFFNTQLGVKFEQYDEQLEESERFNLNGLDSYTFYTELLGVAENREQDYFEAAKLKGNLPACYFGELAQQHLLDTIRPFKQTLSPYLDKATQPLNIDQSFQLGDQTIRLFGQIPSLINGEIIDWRVGDLRDKDRIRAWVHYLVLQTQPSSLPFKYYYRNGKEAKCLTFAPITPTEAQAQLGRYLQDYQRSFRTLTWAVNQEIDSYLKNSAEQVEAEGESWLGKQENPYIRRILAQPYEPDYTELHQRTEAWFGKMVALTRT